jgi:hypothetical protein
MERRWKMRVLSQKFKNGEEKGAQYLEKILLAILQSSFCNLSVGLLDKIMNILSIQTWILIPQNA